MGRKKKRRIVMALTRACAAMDELHARIRDIGHTKRGTANQTRREAEIKRLAALMYLLVIEIKRCEFL
jgi:hypothetical protein